MTRIGHYEILSVLGDGGMGTVYKARDPRFDRTVAVKVLHPHFVREPGVADRFRTEAVIQAKLQHPHIVNVLDFVDDGDTLAMVQEFVSGQPLDELLRARGPQPVAWAVRVIDQVASALGHAHAQGLVHRDVKPSNILVAELDGQPVAKVTDFGIAKVLGTDKLRTATGAKMGTLAYMSPEHIRSPKHVDPRSDVYALGAVLYEILTGQPAFDADTEFDLMDRIVRAPAPRPSLAVPTMPPHLDAVVERAMAKEPGDRFQQCEDLRQALADGRSSTRTLATPLPPVTPPLLATDGIVVDGAPAPRSPAAVAVPRPTGHRAPWMRLLAVGALVLAAVVGFMSYAGQQRRLREQEAQAAQQRLQLERDNERLRLEAQRKAEDARQAAERETEARKERQLNEDRLRRERDQLHQAFFTVRPDGTVSDTRTGLVWASSDGGLRMPWQAAKRFCEAFAGGMRSGWRMPTRAELEALLIEDGKGGLKGPPSIALTEVEYWVSDQARCGGIDSSGRDLTQTCADVVDLSPFSRGQRRVSTLDESHAVLPVLDPRAAPPPQSGGGPLAADAAARLAADDARHARQEEASKLAAASQSREVATRIVGRWWREYSQPVNSGGRTVDGVIRESWRFDGTTLTVEVVKMDVGGVSILQRWKDSPYSKSTDGPLAANGARYTVVGNNVQLTSPNGRFFSFTVRFVGEVAMVLTQSGGSSMTLQRE